VTARETYPSWALVPKHWPLGSSPTPRPAGHAAIAVPPTVRSTNRGWFTAWGGRGQPSAAETTSRA
jgi:hypothetical protein